MRRSLVSHFSMVLTEMVVRVAKSHLRLILRGVRDADENTVRTVVTRFLNVMFGGSDVSQFFWRVPWRMCDAVRAVGCDLLTCCVVVLQSPPRQWRQ